MVDESQRAALQSHPVFDNDTKIISTTTEAESLGSQESRRRLRITIHNNQPLRSEEIIHMTQQCNTTKHKREIQDVGIRVWTNFFINEERILAAEFVIAVLGKQIIKPMKGK
jgi:hypothetical protein